MIADAGNSRTPPIAESDALAEWAALHQAEASAAEADANGKKNGLEWTTRIRLLRLHYGLSLGEAKSIWFNTDTGCSLSEHQEALVPVILDIADACEQEASGR